jgi:uncharacterized HAD superfamily protein
MTGGTRSATHEGLVEPQDAKHVLLLDDSIASGQSMENALQMITRPAPMKKVTAGVGYTSAESKDKVAFYFEVLAMPRWFEWNLMHRPHLATCCLDIDGVLCVDPTPAENDDGDAYRHFLLNAKPGSIPTYQVGHLVTSRLEKYRSETEAWLSLHGVQYGALHMLDMPDAATRRQQKCHADFKASVYRAQKESTLFVESEHQQSLDICRLSGKHVLHYESQALIVPGISYKSLTASGRTLRHRMVGKVEKVLNIVLRS